MTSLSKNGWKKNLSLQSERSFQLTIRHNLLCLMWTVHKELLLLCIQCNMICWTAEEAWDRANIKGCFLAVPLGAVSVMLVYKQMGPLVYFLFYFILFLNRVNLKPGKLHLVLLAAIGMQQSVWTVHLNRTVLCSLLSENMAARVLFSQCCFSEPLPVWLGLVTHPVHTHASLLVISSKVFLGEAWLVICDMAAKLQGRAM